MKNPVILLIMHKNSTFQKLKSELEANAFDVLTANNGKSGFELASKSEPDLILSAIQLDKLDGIDLCYMIRQSANLVDKPYILIADNLNHEERINGYRSGVDAIISASISTRELCTRIETLIKRYEILATQKIDPNTSMIGRITDFSLIEVIQMLNMNQKSGMLAVYHQNAKGEIAFFEGQITWAKFDAQDGENAIAEMVFWKDGIFNFKRDVIQAESNINKPTMQLILDTCQMIDETMMGSKKAIL